MSGHRQRIQIEDIGDVTVIDFVDKKILDEPTAQAIGEQLFSLVDSLGRRRMLLNFGNVEYLSSAFLGKLIALNKKLCTAGGRLVLCNISPEIDQVLEVTGLGRQLGIDRDRDEDDPDGGWGGVLARLKPPKPSGGGAVALRPPPPEPEG
jgi:anti-sigma B factor antagonist